MLYKWVGYYDLIWFNAIVNDYFNGLGTATG